MINVGLIGYGLAGKVFHAPFINSVSGLNLKKIASSKKEEIVQRYPRVQVSTAEDILNDSEIDLVVIATPNEFHFEYAKKALLHNKNVVVDKPFTLTSAEARELTEVSKKQNKLLTVFHNRRFDGDFLTVKKLLKENLLGDIVYFESNFNRFRPEVNKENWRETTKSGGGVFFDLAPHLMDQAICLFGKPTEIFCDIGTFRKDAVNDDYFHMILYFDKMRVHLNAMTVSKHVGERFLIHGTKGSFLKNGLDPQEAKLKEGLDPALQKLGAEEKKYYGLIISDEGEEHITTIDGDYTNYYLNVLNALTKNEEIEVKPSEALLIMQLIEKGIESSESGKRIKL